MTGGQASSSRASTKSPFPEGDPSTGSPAPDSTLSFNISMMMCSDLSVRAYKSSFETTRNCRSMHRPRYGTRSRSPQHLLKFTCQQMSLKPLSLTCKRFREHCAPYLFQVFRMEYYEENLWTQASNRLKSWNTGFSPYVR